MAYRRRRRLRSFRRPRRLVGRIRRRFTPRGRRRGGRRSRRTPIGYRW